MMFSFLLCAEEKVMRAVIDLDSRVRMVRMGLRGNPVYHHYIEASHRLSEELYLNQRFRRLLLEGINSRVHVIPMVYVQACKSAVVSHISG